VSQLDPTVQLAVILTGLWVLATMLARHTQRTLLVFTRSPLFATRVYDILLFPGIVLHELAHVVVATLLRVHVLRVSLFQLRRSNDPRQGEVVVARADPLRMSLIGAAPLLLGIPVVLWLLRVIEIPPQGLSMASLEALRPIARDPLRVAGLYTIWAVANAMFPSAADRAAWRIIAVVGAALALVAWASGQSITLPPALLVSITVAAERLATGLLPVLIGDAVLLVVVVALGHVGMALRRR
jgi:hypothetical protein